MKSAIHFVCERDAQGRLRNLASGGARGVFRCGNWDIPFADAERLIGGWVYLHPTKGARSDFGGKVLACEPIMDAAFARQDRIVFTVEAVTAARGQRWRGAKHQRAWTGGIVPADLPHEA